MSAFWKCLIIGMLWAGGYLLLIAGNGGAW
jgi:hypothetical protein